MTVSAYHRLLIAIVMVVVLLSAASARGRAHHFSRDPPDLSSIYVEWPFTTKQSLLNYQNYVARLSLEYKKNIQIPIEFWTAAPRMAYWGYSFKANEIGTYDITFEQVFDAKDLIDAIRRVIANLSQDGCSYFHTQNVHLGSFSKNSLVFLGDIDGEVRSCGDWPWGGEWKTDVAGISGSVAGTFTFRTQPTSGAAQFRGDLVPNPPNVSINVDLDSIFGVNAHSVAGQILGAVTQISLGPILALTPSDFSMWAIQSFISYDLYRSPQGAVAGLVGIEGGVVSGEINLESSGVEASDWRPRHAEPYHEA